MSVESIREGGCLCGAVRFEVRGEPYKSGLCHCADCRRVTGSAFLAYADWRRHQLQYRGVLAIYAGRSFCPSCGSRLFSLTDDSAEIYLGSLDAAPNNIRPIAEGWIIRREDWQIPITDAAQHSEDILT
jgi:hypothetical protein